MNQFIFIAQTRDGQIHIGTCQAPSGSEARLIIEKLYGADLVHQDLKGVTSKTLTTHTVTCRMESNHT
jgi:hypothetical protein